MYTAPSNASTVDNLFNLEPKINMGLYIKGETKEQDKNSVAIVGTRKPDLYGIKITQKIVKSAIKNNSPYIEIRGVWNAANTPSSAIDFAVNNYRCKDFQVFFLSDLFLF